MKKTLMYYKNFAIIVLFCMIAGSCKKAAQVGSTDELITNAKAWFQKSQEGLTVNVYGRASSMPLRFTPLWEKAQTKVIDGSNVLLVRVNTNLTKAMGSQVQFSLLVKDNGESYESKVVSVRETGDKLGSTMSVNDLFYAAFTNKNISDTKAMNFDVTLFNSKYQATRLVRFTQQNRQDIFFDRTGLKVSASDADGSLKLPKDNIFANIKPPTQDCVEQEWYMVQPIFDEYGDFEYYEVLWQLPSTWICDGGAMGGTPSSINVDFGSSVSEEMGSSSESTEVIGAETFKVKTLTWKYHNGYTFYGQSSERGAVKITGTTRTWNSITHVSNLMVGYWPSGSVEFIGVTFTPHVLSGSNTGMMEVDYQVKYTLTGTAYGPSYTSPPKWSASTWNANFVKQ